MELDVQVPAMNESMVHSEYEDWWTPRSI